jgi:CheY-like chemotaxis protein
MSQPYPTVGRSLVVLHVDDDPMNLRVVEEILTAFHHRSVKASSGAEALRHVADQAFDVILMDIHMPGMSGIETVERLRALPGPGRDTPVIALTADVNSRRPEDYKALGFDGYVSKPILVSGLLDAIKAAAEPQSAPAVSPYRINRAV